MRKLTTEEFVARAREVHGDTYDYSHVIYDGNNKKVEIICPEHGAFWQTPNNHLAGKGCRSCAKNQPYTTETFIAAARKVHGNKYDYSQVQYTAYHDKVTIICPVHGAFQQVASDHLHGCGCGKCTKSRGHLKRNHAAEEVKREHTLMQRYGVAHALQSEAFKNKAKDTWRAHYNVDHPMKTDKVKQQVCDTMLERYGVTNAMQFSEIQRKSLETRIANGSFVKSKVECQLTELLQNVFGTGMIKTQYVDDVRYPHACDFYLPVRDMFIELNAAWTHGHGWYDANNIDCQQKLSTWQAKAKTSKYYQNAIETWTGYDVKKRQDARIHDLNYVVFWDNDLADAKAWIEAGCPDRRDWQ